MDFELPPEDDPRRLAVREWLEEHPEPSDEQLAEAGYVAPHWPRPYGLDADPIHQLVIDEELRRAGVRRPQNMIGIGWAGPTLLAAGTPEQQARYLPRLLSAADIWCQLFSEPGAGSDLASLATSAVRDGDEWVVNGQKIWTSMGHLARYGILIARTDRDVPKHKGITYFVCPMEAEGIEVRPIIEMTGGHTFNEVFFTDVRVPAENLVGPLNGGWGVANGSLGHERTMMWLGFADRIHNVLGDFRPRTPLERDQFASGVMDYHALRLMGSRGLAKAARGETDVAGVSVVKLFGSEAELRLAEHALTAAGPDGLMHPAMSGPYAHMNLDHYFASWFERYARSFSGTIAGGTSEIQRNIIAQQVLGLPRGK